MNFLGKLFRFRNGVVFVPLVLASGFLFFEWWLVMIVTLLGVIVWCFLEEGKYKMGNIKFTWFLLGLLALFVLTRLYPFWVSSHPLGYDTGIYRYEFWASFQALPEYVSGLFLGLPLITDVLSLFGASLDYVLYGFYVLVSALAGLSIAAALRVSKNTSAALLGLFLFSVSMIQWTTYEMILFKQVLALAFVFGSFLLLQRRSFWVLLFLVFLALLQPLDAFLLSLSILVYGVFQIFVSPKSRSYFIPLFLIGFVGILGLLLVDPHFWFNAWTIFSVGLIDPLQIEAPLRQGVFLSLTDYGYQSAFFFVFGVLGWLYEIRQRRVSIVSVYFVFLLAWIALKLFFYQRLLIQFDAVLIYFASLALLSFYQGFAVDRVGKSLFVVLMLGLLLPFGMTLARFQPQVPPEELTSLRAFCSDLPPQVYVASTDSAYSPWVKGFCLQQRVFGPGLFADNRWSRSDWEVFWSGDGKKIPSLLEKYEEPVFFYVGKGQTQLSFDEQLFEQVDEQWWVNR